jgi:hypothetical protein
MIPAGEMLDPEMERVVVPVRGARVCPLVGAGWS